ncbi:hypothetical protein AB0C51_09780 [Streptomyces pathocidini]|uniref:hypothetical protein n=1 Tax=Streptomyces pathocidini TaxID=1650571 RepID=UPI0033E20D35
MSNEADQKGSSRDIGLVIGQREYSRRTALLVLGGACLLFIAIFGGVITLIVLGKRRTARNDEEQADLVKLAQTRHWSYSASKSGAVDRYSGADPFPTASFNVTAWDYIEGRYRGRSFACFEYRDKNNNGHTRPQDKQQYFAVFAVATAASIPRVVIREHKLLDGVFAGGEVVELGDSKFDGKFRVVTSDVRTAREVLEGRLAHFLTTDSRAQDAPLRFDRGELITWYEGRLRPDEVLPHLDFLCDALECVPERAWH